MKNKHKIKIIDLPNNFFYSNGFIDWKAVVEYAENENVKILDFSGFDTATDLLFWYFKSYLPPTLSLKIDVKKFLLNGCSYITIWSMYYLNKILGWNMFNDPAIQLNEKITCCPRISESLIVSLNHGINNLLKDSNIYNQAKCVIINSDSFNSKIIESLEQNINASKDNDSFFQTTRLKNDKNQILNLYQCSQSLCGIFLTERNFVVLTYDMTEKEDDIKQSILSRILQVLSANILPIGILIVGIGGHDNKIMTNVDRKIKNSLKKIQKFLFKLVDSQIKNIQNLDFKLQLELSELINLSEKIGMILKIIEFGIASFKEDMYELLIYKINLYQDPRIKLYLDDIKKNAKKIRKEDLDELKSFKAPPTIVQFIAEATCYLFAKKANYQNFVKLLNKNDFLARLKNFDSNSINDYKLKRLREYIEMPEFDSVTAANVSLSASILCDWIHSVYNYGLSIEKIETEEEKFTVVIKTKLKDYLLEKSFYFFNWNLYYNDQYENSEKEIDDLINMSIDLKNKPILTLDELNQLFLQNEKLRDYQSNKFKQLSLRYVRAQNARGIFFFNEKTKFIITDLNWLKQIFDILSKSNKEESGLNLMSLNVPVWKISSLNEKLKKLCINQQIFDYILSFLRENNLILVTEKEEVISLFCLRESPDSTFNEWNEKWSDLEYKISWELFSPLPLNVFAEFVSLFFSRKTCLKLHKNGFLYQDTHFNAMIRFSKTELVLCVRMIDPERYFSLPDQSYLKYFKTTYMNFYIYLWHLLIKYHIPHRLNFENDSFKHPILTENNETKLEIINSKDVFQIYDLIKKNDIFYFKTQIGKYLHNFLLTDTNQLKCAECSIDLNFLIHIKNAFFILYPELNEINVKKTVIPLFWGTDKSTDNNFVTAFEPQVVITDQNSEMFSFKFIENDLTTAERIYLILACYDSTEVNSIWIDLNKMNIEYDQNSTKIKIKNSLFEFKSDKNTKISIGDNLLISIQKKSDKIKKAEVRLNGILFLEIEFVQDYLVPMFSFINDAEDFPVKANILSKCLQYNNSIDIKKYTKTDFSSLINHCLEARDRQFPNLISPATIIDFRENSVLIHFDGWASNYEYWTEIRSSDLRPVGWTEYHLRKIKEKKLVIDYELRNIQFDVPSQLKNNSSKVFSWEDYLQDKNASAVPFDIFSMDQKSGMTLSDFKGNKNQQVLTSCLNSPNSNLKIRNFKNLIHQNWTNLIEKNIITTIGSSPTPTRGILPLPRKIKYFSSNNTFNLLNDFNLHFCCLNMSTDNQITFAHMLDAKGSSMKNKTFDSNDLILIILSSYMILYSKFSSIIPKKSKIFSDQSENFDENKLSLQVRNYLKSLIKYLGLFVNEREMLERKFECNIIKYLELLPTEVMESNVFKFEKCSPNSNLAECYYCHTASENFRSPNKIDILLGGEFIKYSEFCTRYSIIDSNSFLNLDSQYAEKYPNLTSLMLINVPVNIKSTTFFKQFSFLTNVKLVQNNIDNLPDSLLEVHGLKTLYFNNVINLANISLENMKSLEILELENVLVDENKKCLIKLPDSIKTIKVSQSSFSQFFLKVNPESIHDLKLSAIPLIDMDKYGKSNSLISIENFIREIKSSKLITNNQINKLFSHFDLNKNGFLDFNEMVKVNAFLFKKYSRLGPNIPSEIYQMKNLKVLDLSYQSILQISDDIENLKNLNTLILNNCILLKDISPKIANLPLSKFDLTNCLSLTTPPREIVNRGIHSIQTYLRRLLTGSIELKRTKLMVVGLGQAGKTSLLRSLRGFDHQSVSELTDGIKIDDWIIDLNDGSTLTYSMWDFAGQSVYYNTHQFFLSSRGVYLLVWNVRSGSEYAGLEFWLNSISSHAPGAPIFIVGTHIDQVFKYVLDEEHLKSKFKDIVGFFFVSCCTGQGVEELKNALIETTLSQSYINEKIPEAWLNFEKSLKLKSKNESILSFENLRPFAEENGIYDSEEILQAIKFLNDLGSVQYFENKSLKNKVIINPQWIVNAFTNVVSVRQTSISNGKLTHDKIREIWKDYDENLHTWMLKLTEEFDLTFPVPEKNMSIVPCLLPDTEPPFNWPDINSNSSIKVKEFKVIYKFDYLPIGLFNRIQVRLFQYGDNSIIWKKGSFLKKNSHVALITQSKDTLSIQIKVQGIKPENVVFVIHETIETLINDSFNGLNYDFSFPCPDCMEIQTTEPYLFSSRLLKRANEMRAQFLQCRRYFHVISVQEMMSIMPIDNTHYMEMNLEYTMRDLNNFKSMCKYDIIFWYCEQDTKLDKDDSVDPLNVINDLRSHGLKIWYTQDPLKEKLDNVFKIIKQAKMVLLGISDNFALDTRCQEVFEIVKSIIKKPYLLVEFGLQNDRKWLKNPYFASICADFRVIMKNPKRYKSKILDLIESIEKITNNVPNLDVDKKDSDVFISYCWANSHDAIRKGTKGTDQSLGWLDPRSLVNFFAENGINAWLDIDNLDSTTQMFGEITKGMNSAKVIVACVSDEYVQSQNCKQEFRFAHISLKIPIVKAIVGLGNEWKKNEIAFLGSTYPEVNFQNESSEAYSLLLNYVRDELSKHEEKKSKKESNNSNILIDSNNTAIQELYELTQRKFLRQLIQFSSLISTTRSYPRLFCIDFLNEEKISKLKFIKNLKKMTSAFGAEKIYTEINEENIINSKLVPCVRPMCEHEESWHFSDCFVILPELLNIYCPYLIRLITILKNGSSSNELGVFLTEQGNKLLSEMEKSMDESIDLFDSYNSFRNIFINEFESDRFYSLSWLSDNWNDKPLGLENCELRNAKILWLCKKHCEETDAEILSDQDNFTTDSIEKEKNFLIEELDNIDLNIY